VPDETDAFGRPLRPESSDPFGAPVEQERESHAPPGWAPPAAPPDAPETTWGPPVSPGAPAGELSGWWRRVGASIIDGLLIGIVGAVIAALISATTDLTEDERTAISLGIGIAIGVIYYGLTMSRPGEHNGRTWGKQVTGIKVTRIDGVAVTFGFAFVREILVKTLLFGYLAILTLYIATVLNYLWPLWDGRNQALHDKIVKTQVHRMP
jgi:uncharacterized RDD family membrane protein YckC